MGRVAIVFAALACSVTARAEVRRDPSLGWNELAPAVSGRDATVTLTDGQRIKGKIRNVEPGGLRMRVQFATDEKRFPSKTLLVPGDLVSNIRLEKRTRRWRAILTPGIPLVLVTAMAQAVNGIHPEPDARKVIGIGAGVAAGGAIGGYILGWRLDRQETVNITVIR